MRPTPESKLAPYLEHLEHWFGVEQVTLAEAQTRLRALGCSASKSRLSSWWRARQQANLQAKLLEQLATGARQCAEIEAEFGRNPPPALETLIKLHRVLALKFSTQANLAPEVLGLVTQLMRPVMEFARLEEKRQERALAEQKYRDQVAAQKASQKTDPAGEALTSETLTKIERELKLF